MAPLHHHFELEGWSETTADPLWLVGTVMGLIGLLGAL